MASLALALKEEIRRLARKEIKARTGATAQMVADHRRDIAALKRLTRDQARKIAYLEGQERKRQPELGNGNDGSFRFSARSVQAQRKRSGLSAAEYAKLVGVSGLTIYNWEHGKSRPRPQQLAALIALRGIGKRQAQAKLESLNGAKNGSPSKARKRKS